MRHAAPGRARVGVSLTRAAVWVLVSWVGAVVGVVLGVVDGNWTAALYAFANAASAAGWVIALRTAEMWRGVAEGLAEGLESWRPPLDGEDHPDDGAPGDWHWR